MATQNLVFASLTAETRADVLEKLTAIKKSLGFLLTLKADQKQSLFKVGNGYTPFVEKAYNVVNAHPDILPGVFDINEFKKDYQLSKDLTMIVDQIRQLADSLNDTLMAVNSDAITEALEVYSSVKQNSNRVPGLKVSETEWLGDIIECLIILGVTMNRKSVVLGAVYGIMCMVAIFFS